MGNRVDGFLEVAKVLIELYQKLLREQRIDRTHTSHAIINKGSISTIEQQLLLCIVVTATEIKEVIFSIPNEKSLGPDGRARWILEWVLHSLLGRNGPLGM